MTARVGVCELLVVVKQRLSVSRPFLACVLTALAPDGHHAHLHVYLGYFAGILSVQQAPDGSWQALVEPRVTMEQLVRTVPQFFVTMPGSRGSACALCAGLPPGV